MKKIYKYEIQETDTQILRLPVGTQILSFQTQAVHGFCKMFIWCMVEMENDVEDRKFRVYGTGHEIQDDKSQKYYIGTVQKGMFVWHLFEVID